MYFAHLHVHSHYSLLDGMSKIDELLDLTQKMGLNALALTDHGVMYGAIEFYTKAKERGIKPIVGCEVYLAPSSRFDKVPKIDTKFYHLTLLAKNQIGYKNLLKLVTIGELEGFYYKPRIDKEVLKQHSEGLIALSGCLRGEIPQSLLADNFKKAKELIKEYQEIFGSENFYLELQDHPELKEQNKINGYLLRLSDESQTPAVVTCDSHYPLKDDKNIHEVLLAVQTGSGMENEDRLTMVHADLHLKSPEEVSANFQNHPELFENIQKIVENCNLELDLGKIIFPKFKTPDNKPSFEYLEDLARHNFIRIYGKDNKEATARLEHELKVIKQTDFSDYFLVIYDVIHFARENNILTNTRGSAAGSLVAYVLGISNIDPIKYELYFERFLNPERIEPPDIDFDVADDKRQELIAYINNKYGQDYVAQVLTFGIMKSRLAVRDVARALGRPYALGDQIAKLIPQNLPLEEALKSIPELKTLYNTNNDVKEIVDIAKRLEGVARHASTHAAGIVIAPEPIVNFAPLQHSSRSEQDVVTQYEMHALKNIGLIKIDILGLANLTVIYNALRIIRKVYDKDIDLDDLGFEDRKVYQLLGRGDTVGLFQVECLSGDTIVSNTTIKKLYEKQEKKRLISVYLDEGKTHLNGIKEVIKKGKQGVYTLITENNWYIKSTKEHCFLTDKGWKKLEEIKSGDKILIKHKAKHLIYNTCKSCGKQTSGQKERTEEFKKKLSVRMSGENNPMFGKLSPHRKGGFREDLGHYVRSTWEADFARILKYCKVDYSYESQSFKLIKPDGEIIHYTPDFYVESKNTFYEIKGWLHDKDKKKIDLFQKQYPKYRFILINTTKFAEFALRYQNLVNWECPRIPVKQGFDFTAVKEIKYSGKADTYDIVMESPGNNFVANGFLVHNSGGMRRYLQELKPTKLEDITAMLALYRPGPMELIPQFIRRKHGEEKIIYLHPDLKPILENTYGICVYQEQLMKIAHDLAGFSMAEADVLRKAVGKKIKSLLDAQKAKLLKGMAERHISKEVAQKIWEWVEPFARYGFNKGHSSSYARITYQTAWLKAYYPYVFMAALLTSDFGNLDRVAIEVKECERLGIKVMPPSVNYSFIEFGIDKDTNNILFSLSAIKNVGVGAAGMIQEERKNNGQFKNLTDFCKRIPRQVLNRKTLESLIKSGALDCFGSRELMADNLDKILEWSYCLNNNHNQAQRGLFNDDNDDILPKLGEIPSVDKTKRLLWEREYLGIYISGHPLDDYKNILGKVALTINQVHNLPLGQRIKVCGFISRIQKIRTKVGKPMVFSQISDFERSIDVVLYPTILANYVSGLTEDKVVIVEGRTDKRNGEYQIIGERMEEIKPMEA